MDQPAPARRLRTVRLAIALALPCAVAPWLPFGAGTWWPFDLGAHFPHHCALGLAVASLLLVAARRWLLAVCLLPSLALCAVRLWPLAGSSSPTAAAAPADAVPLRIAAANLCCDNDHPEALAPEVAAFAPDLVALTEFTPTAAQRLAAVRATFPHRCEEPRADAFGVALWSRLPLSRADIAQLAGERFPVIAAVVATASGPVGVVVAHPPPPMGARWTAARDRMIAALPELLATLPPHHLVAGDLNATRWSAALAALLQQSRLRDSCEGRGLSASWPSFLPRWLGIPIDHVLASPDLAVADRRVGDPFGSDHLPVFATLLLPPTR